MEVSGWKWVGCSCRSGWIRVSATPNQTGLEALQQGDLDIFTFPTRFPSVDDHHCSWSSEKEMSFEIRDFHLPPGQPSIWISGPVWFGVAGVRVHPFWWGCFAYFYLEISMLLTFMSQWMVFMGRWVLPTYVCFGFVLSMSQWTLPTGHQILFICTHFGFCFVLALHFLLHLYGSSWWESEGEVSSRGRFITVSGYTFYSTSQ